MRKIANLVLLVSLVLSISACQTKSEIGDEIKTDNYNAYADIDMSKTLSLSSEAEVNLVISDSEEMYNTATHVALVHVNSIDGGSNINEQTKEYCYPYTYGKMTIIESYKGDLSKDQSIEYVRMGGIISYDDYYSSLYASQQEKMGQLENKPEYVKMKFGEDIDIEVGKDYLVYLDNREDEDVKLAHQNAYGVIGWEGGLREVNTTATTRSSNTSVQLYNNITNQWENLESVYGLK